ncbi:MATE family efflux transporter [Dielma fastidiosa]|uniref:MATE family efflux transporter n=1 Tax=Dielma fastidiosa TaxID=1034346 RepID=UPI000ED8A037|nr:MATE family efflux transporter [Dielma fastidiosa]HAH94214.1 MATE family efflux transporter [Dielma fastidiosa]
MTNRNTITNDMTVGSPVRLILVFAIPLFIGNVFQQIYNVADTMIAGYNIGDAAIAAIGATSSLFSLLMNFASGLNSGYGIVVARAFGAKDQEKLKRSIASMVILNLAITLMITSFSLCFLTPLMKLMNIPDSIFSDAYAYIAIIIAGMLATIIYNMLAGIMRAVGNSKTPLYFLIISCAINLSLDCLFIIGFSWGVEGAALATVIAESLSAILSGIYVLCKYHEILPSRQHFYLEIPLLKEMAATGFAMAFMLCVVDIGSVLYQRAINGLGEMLIVAHTSARKIIGIMMMPLASIATAYSTFTSQNWGAGKTRRIHQALKKVMAMEIGWGLLSCFIVLLLGSTTVRMLTGTADNYIIDNAVLSLNFHFVCFPALGVLLALRTSLQAIGRKLLPIISSSLELIVKLIAGIWLIPRWGYWSVCLTEPIIWVSCALFLIIVFLIQKPFNIKEELNDRT